MDTMKINGREVMLDRCSKCGVVENIDLLDGGKEDDNGRGLYCLPCYGPMWSPFRNSDIDYSVAQSLTDAYEHWRTHQ